MDHKELCQHLILFLFLIITINTSTFFVEKYSEAYYKLHSVSFIINFVGISLFFGRLKHIKKLWMEEVKSLKEYEIKEYKLIITCFSISSMSIIFITDVFSAGIEYFAFVLITLIVGFYYTIRDFFS